jgi:uncharacterized protein YkwD
MAGIHPRSGLLFKPPRLSHESEAEMAKRLAVACVAMSLLIPCDEAASSKARTAERAMLQAVNEAREDHGRRTLRYSRALERSAGRLAAKLVKLDVFGHLESAPAGSGARGEALAYHRGWRALTRSTVRLWLRSPSHRAVILGRFRAVGAGIKRGRIGGRLTTVWVLHVGAP